MINTHATLIKILPLIHVMSSAQLVWLRRLGWAGHVVHHNELIVHEVVFSQVDLKRRGRHSSPNSSSRLGRRCQSHLQFCQLGCLATGQQGVQPHLLIIRWTSW